MQLVGAVSCSECGVKIGEWLEGHLFVARGGVVIAIDPEVIPCKVTGCPGSYRRTAAAPIDVVGTLRGRDRARERASA